MTRFPILACAAAALLAGCDNDVDLLSGEAPLPVVYGVFNATDSVQLISVTKTFAFAEGGGARESAQTPDSVYYGTEEVTVTVANARTGQSLPAERLPAAELGVERESGDFAVAPNFVYRYSSVGLDLQPGDAVEVAVERAGELIGTARADVLPELTFIQARRPPERVGFTSELDYSLSWRRGEAAANELAVYELGFVFAYLETDAAGATVAREVYWPAATGLSAEVNAAGVPINGFFDFLAANLPADPDLTRRFRYVQVVITGGDEDFVAYAELLRANAGITATQQLPPFTNVDGGLGLYAGITQLRQDTFGTLTPASFDELFDGERLQPLNFVP